MAFSLGRNNPSSQKFNFTIVENSTIIQPIIFFPYRIGGSHEFSGVEFTDEDDERVCTQADKGKHR